MNTTPMTAHSGADGFTLLELVVTVALAGILAATAVPSFQDLVKENRLTSQVNDFIAANNLARSEAVRRGSFGALCASSDGVNCATAGGFAQGWIVFADDGSSRCTVEEEEEVLRVRTALEPLNANGSSRQTVNGPSNVRCLRYKADGLLDGVSNGTFRFCDDRDGENNTARHVVLNRTGRVRVQRGACS